MVIQNKIDEQIRMLDERSINKKFENIVAFHKVSALKDIGMEELIDDIKLNIIALDHIGDTLPKNWIEIRKELESLTNNFISYREYPSDLTVYERNIDRQRKWGKVVLSQTISPGGSHADQRNLSYLDLANLRSASKTAKNASSEFCVVGSRYLS